MSSKLVAKQREALRIEMQKERDAREENGGASVWRQAKERAGQCLQQKYQGQFQIFFSKFVNDLVQRSKCTKEIVQFHDQCILDQQGEYLKRVYHYYNADGDLQISDRISLFAGYYSRAIILRYEYPMMVLTSTREIFQRRLRRIKKTLAEEGSSDDTLSSSSHNPMSLDSATFLQELPSQELQRLSQDSSNIYEAINLSQLSIFHDPNDLAHNMFHDPCDSSMYSQHSKQSNIDCIPQHHNIIPFKKDKRGKQEVEFLINLNKGVSHLVTDLQEFDMEQVIARYRKIGKKKQFNHKNSTGVTREGPSTERLILPRKNNKNNRKQEYNKNNRKQEYNKNNRKQEQRQNRKDQFEAKQRRLTREQVRCSYGLKKNFLPYENKQFLATVSHGLHTPYTSPYKYSFLHNMDYDMQCYGEQEKRSYESSLEDRVYRYDGRSRHRNDMIGNNNIAQYKMKETEARKRLEIRLRAKELLNRVKSQGSLI